MSKVSLCVIFLFFLVAKVELDLNKPCDTLQLTEVIKMESFENGTQIDYSFKNDECCIDFETGPREFLLLANSKNLEDDMLLLDGSVYLLEAYHAEDVHCQKHSRRNLDTMQPQATQDTVSQASPVVTLVNPVNPVEAKGHVARSEPASVQGKTEVSSVNQEVKERREMPGK